MPLPSQAVAFDLESREIRERPLPSFRIEPEKKREVYWVHLNSHGSEDFKKVSSDLNLSEELLRDLKTADSMPNVTESEDALTLVLPSLNCSPDGSPEAEAVRIVLHLTDRYCLTMADQAVPAIDHFAATYRREFRYAQTPGFILFLILENLVEDLTRISRNLEKRSELIDEEIQGNFEEHLSASVLELKRQVITLKGVVSSLRDTLMRISGKKIPVVSEACRQSLTEVYGHAQSLANQIDSLRDLVHNTLETYNTALAQRMNQTMKILTVFAAIILPMTLITGIYGMNFQWIPELSWRHGYLFAIGLMIACGAGLFLFFKKKGWF